MFANLKLRFSRPHFLMLLLGQLVQFLLLRSDLTPERLFMSAVEALQFSGVLLVLIFHEDGV